jgi:hypothetical protein
MALDIQTVHHILKNTAVQNVNKPCLLHYGLYFHFNCADFGEKTPNFTCFTCYLLGKEP